MVDINKFRSIIILILLVVCVYGCSNKTEKRSYTPVTVKWQLRDIDYDPYDTIYYKTYYDNFVRGFIMNIKYPDINIQEKLEDYFIIKENSDEQMNMLVDMFFDDRTINIEEEELKDLFYSHGYFLYLSHENIQDIQVRFIEIQEIDGPSLYPSRILIQSWDEEHVYLQDITGPIPRKIRSLLVIDNKKSPQVIMHSSGSSDDYVSEEELSFWTYRGSYWILTPLELEIDTSHAHSAGDMYPDIDRSTLFEPTYYRDGIVYRPSVQGDGLHSATFRLGKMEETEKNKSFRLTAIYESLGRTVEDRGAYIQFEIK